MLFNGNPTNYSFRKASIHQAFLAIDVGFPVVVILRKTAYYMPFDGLFQQSIDSFLV